MDFKALVKPAAIAGLIMCVVSVIIGLIGAIPFVGCITGIVGCILGFIPGVLGCFIAGLGGKKLSVGEGAVLGAMTGPIVALSSFITVPASVFLGSAIQTSMVSTLGADVSSPPVADSIMPVVIATPIVFVVGSIVLAVINAGMGALYAVIKNR